MARPRPASRKKSPRRFGLQPKSGHFTRDIAFEPDGSLYLAFGSQDNIRTTSRAREVFQINADGSISDFASGIRNPVGIAFYPGTTTLCRHQRARRAWRRSGARLSHQRQAGRFLWLALRLYRPASRSRWGSKSGDIVARPKRRMCCSTPIPRRSVWRSTTAATFRPTTRAMPSSRCTARGTTAIPPATRWCACISRMASR